MAAASEFSVTYAVIRCVLTRIYMTSNNGHESCQLSAWKFVRTDWARC